MKTNYFSRRQKLYKMKTAYKRDFYYEDIFQLSFQ